MPGRSVCLLPSRALIQPRRLSLLPADATTQQVAAVLTGHAGALEVAADRRQQAADPRQQAAKLRQQAVSEPEQAAALGQQAAALELEALKFDAFPVGAILARSTAGRQDGQHMAAMLKWLPAALQHPPLEDLQPQLQAALSSLSSGEGLDSKAVRTLCGHLRPRLPSLPGGLVGAVYQIAAAAGQHRMESDEHVVFVLAVRSIQLCGGCCCW